MSKIVKTIVIQEVNDYKEFFEEYMIHDKLSSHEWDFTFQVDYTQKQSVDVSLLFYYYLFSNKCSAEYPNVSVSLRMQTVYREKENKNGKKTKDDRDYFALSAYAYIQENSKERKSNSAQILTLNRYGKSIQARSVQRAPIKGIRKHLPIISVDKKSYGFLQSQAGSHWNKICGYKSLCLDSLENIVLYLCGNALFGDTGYRNLNMVRQWTFGSGLFWEAIEEISVLALLIFSLYDVHLRCDLTAKYRELTSNSLIREELFFNEFQAEQKRREFDIYCHMKSEYGDIKSLFEKTNKSDNGHSYGKLSEFSSKFAEKTALLLGIQDAKAADKFSKEAMPVLLEMWIRRNEKGCIEAAYNAIISLKKVKQDTMQMNNAEVHTDSENREKKEKIFSCFREYIEFVENEFKYYFLHPQVVKELYESIIISEGLLQLIENIVYHAGSGSDNGCGVMDIRILAFDDDKDKTIIDRYQRYIAQTRNSLRQNIKYWMEIKIADLSMTNVVENFYKTNCDVIEKLKMKLPGEVDKLKNMTLTSFFRPKEEEIEAWNIYYGCDDGENDRAVNHFGLQIFDSIVNSKGGTFLAGSQKEKFQENDIQIEIPGTLYNILLPLDEKTLKDENIYDTMLGYNIQQFISKSASGKISIKNIDVPIRNINSLQEKEAYVRDIAACMKIEPRESDIIYIQQIDVRKQNIECLVKGVLLYIFQRDVDEALKIAFINCKQYQMLEMVRIIALYYDRQERNSKMKNVQLYIRGKRIEEELLLYGDTLAELKNNLALSACVRGVTYQNLHTINTILSRKNNPGIGGKKIEQF